MAAPFLAAILGAWVFVTLPAQAFAQSFTDYPRANTWPNLSTACLDALSTPVTCSKILAFSAENNVPRLSVEDLTDLCTTDCLNSLNSAKTAIQSACTLPTDVMPPEYGNLPATFMVDLFIYTYGLNCRRDATTQDYCDVLFIEWMNQPSGKLTAAQECSDCMLGISQRQLNSPFGYDEAFASAFISLTSSCSKPGYAFTSPAPYVTTGTASSTASSASPTAELDPGCVTLYTTQTGDTCDSIAVSKNVSTFAVYGSSGLKKACSALPTGIKLCLLGQCRIYQVQEGDTCDGIITAAGITVSPSMFVAWNPNINSVCSNLPHLVGQYICLSRPDGLSNPNIAIPSAAVLATGTVWPTMVPTTSAQLPIAPGTLTECTNYTNHVDTTIYDSVYQPQMPLNLDIANRCTYVAAANGITLAQLLDWNPSLDANQDPCTLAAGYSYCVRNGPIVPRPFGICITPNTSIIPASTVSSCSCYTQYSGYDSEYTDCTTLSSDFGLTLAELQLMNPWLAGSPTACNTALFANLTGEAHRQLCVRNLGTAPSGTTSTTSSTTSSTSTPPPASSSSTIPPGSVCIAGTDTGNPNQSGLCSFCCHYNYCPPGPCVCTAYGTPVPPPPNTGIAGYKLATLDDSYIGLCSYVYDHGYYATGACTSNADGSPQS